LNQGFLKAYQDTLFEDWDQKYALQAQEKFLIL